MVEKLSVSEIRQMGLKPSSEPHAAHPKFTPVPMFLPTRTFGNNVVTVMTRQKFLDANISHWIAWRVNKIIAYALSGAAIILLFSNVYLSALAGLGAGWFYGKFIWEQFYVTQLLGKRRLLEST
ncbi:hypothetical protein HY095_02440 [Candidatus Micrarchaeota archaeon]|nr:hypothetical protein [Candidatus Micrarchaeota archaeon]